MNEQLEGIEIVVQDGRYNAYGPDTPRSKELFELLQEMGGIDETVAEGVYTFNVEQLAEDHYVTTLLPKE